MNQKTIKKYSSLSFKKYREKYGLFLAEGYHPVEELLRSDWEIEAILTSNSENYRQLKLRKRLKAVELVKPEIIKKIAETKTPQDVLAIVEIRALEKSELLPHKRIVIADGIKDPGNMGTIIRTAAAFDFRAVATTSRSVDIFNPKTVRATQGALFKIAVFPDITTTYIKDKLKSNYTLYALDPDGDSDIDNIEPENKSAIIIGSEIEGIGNPLLDLADHRVRISLSSRVDSLNAAVAAGIAMRKFSSKSKI